MAPLVYDGQNRVTSNSVGALPTAKDEFWYDPDGERFLGRETWQGSGTQTALTVCLGNFEEVIPAAGGSYKLIQRTELTASVRHIRTRTTGGVYASRFEYVHRDQLGSVDVVTDAAGMQLNDKLSFDTFGGRRQYTWASDITAASKTTILSNEDERFARGYTDHEQLNRTGFIHMNGRVYDPRIGRFVSADPIVQAPFHSQSYNRYAYVFNSPLSYSDPSGYALAPEDRYCRSGPCPPRAEVMIPVHSSEIWTQMMWDIYLGATDFNGAGGGGVDDGAYQPPAGEPPSAVDTHASDWSWLAGMDPNSGPPDFDSMGDQALLDWILVHANEFGIRFGPNFKTLRATGDRVADQRVEGRLKRVPCPARSCSGRVTEVLGEAGPLGPEVLIYRGALEARIPYYFDVGNAIVTEQYSRVEMAIHVVAHEAAHTRGIDVRRSEQDPNGQHPLANQAGQMAVDRFRTRYRVSP